MARCGPRYRRRVPAPPLDIRRVAAADTRDLRRRVLRPHQVADQLVYPGDDHPHAAHFGAVDPDGVVVATGTVVPEAPPWEPGRAPAWRLRGMATEPAYRGRGVGGRILAAAVDHVAAHGGGLLWCNARLPAVGFYRRAGFAGRGEPWDEPDIGPHLVMARTVEPTGPPPPSG